MILSTGFQPQNLTSVSDKATCLISCAPYTTENTVVQALKLVTKHMLYIVVVSIFILFCALSIQNA